MRIEWSSLRDSLLDARIQKLLIMIGGLISALAVGIWTVHVEYCRAPRHADTKPNDAAYTIILRQTTGVTPDAFSALAKQYGVTEAALKSFFQSLDRQEVPPHELDSTLRSIADRYKALENSLRTASTDTKVGSLKESARRALEDGNLKRAEKMLIKAKETDLRVAQLRPGEADQRLLSAATTSAALAELTAIELDNERASAYYREAASLLPEGEALLRAHYLTESARHSVNGGVLEEAVEPLEEAIALRRHALGESDPKVAETVIQLAQVLSKLGRFPEAASLYQEVLTKRERDLGLENNKVADLLISLGSVYYEQGRYADANAKLQRALNIRRNALGPCSPDVADALHELAKVVDEQGGYEEAASYNEQALRIRKAVFGEQNPDVADSLNNLAINYLHLNRFEQAESLLQRALEIRREAFGPDASVVAINLNNLGALYARLGRNDEALSTFERALEIQERSSEQNRLDIGYTLTNLAHLKHITGGEGKEAQALLERALFVLQERLGSNHPKVADTLIELGLFQQSQGRYEEAHGAFDRALKIRAEVFGRDHQLTKATQTLVDQCSRQRTTSDREE